MIEMSALCFVRMEDEPMNLHHGIGWLEIE